MLGNDPRGRRTPKWWNPADSRFKGGTYWTHIVPWMAIFDGVGNAATNTRVELRNMKAYYKSRSSGQWVLLSQGRIEGENYPKGLNAVVAGRPDIVSVGSGVVSVRPPNGDLHFHGWCCGRALPDPSDIAAIHVTLQARLAVHDASRPDDRPVARYLVQVGGDYYPDASLNLRAFAPDQWNPGIGLSRSKLVGNAWQSYSFTTIDVGVQDPGGAAISEAEDLTQHKSKTADRGLRLHRLVLALRRARAQLRGARARNRLTDCTRSMIPRHHRISSPSESTSRQFEPIWISIRDPFKRQTDRGRKSVLS